MQATDNTITKAEYARRKGWNRSHVTRLAQKGKIKLDERGMIDPALADKMLAENMDPARAYLKPPPPPVDGDDTEREQEIPASVLQSNPLMAETFLKVRILKEKYAAGLKQIELEERKGKLIEISQIEKTLFDKNRAIRNMIQNIPGRFASVIAAEIIAELKQLLKHNKDIFTPIQKILNEKTQSILVEEINNILTEMSGGIN